MNVRIVQRYLEDEETGDRKLSGLCLVPETAEEHRSVEQLFGRTEYPDGIRGSPSRAVVSLDGELAPYIYIEKPPTR